MEIEIKKHTDKELVIQISGETHTLGNLIAKEAMNHPHVVFASYRVPHPLINKIELTIVVDDSYDVDRAFIEIIENVRDYLKDFKRLVEEKL